MILISLTLCFMSQTWGNVLPSASPVSLEKKNSTLSAVGDASTPNHNNTANSTKWESKFDPRNHLTPDRIKFITYAGKVISALHSDPKYEEMKERLKDPKAEDRTLVSLMAMMSNKTCDLLNKIKSEQIQAVEKQKKCPNNKEEYKPDYIDLSSPEKFNAIDLHLVIGKVATMRSILEELVQNKPGRS